MKEKTELNINQFISFNLTDKGEEYINNSNAHGDLYNSPLIDYRYSATLRDVMSILGHKLFVGSLPILESNLFFNSASEKLVSLNDRATFTLTEKGVSLLNDFCEKEMAELKTPYKRPVNVIEDNVTTMTVHEFFYVFGKILTETDESIILDDSVSVELG